MRGDRVVVALALASLAAAGVAAVLIGTPPLATRGADAGEEFLRAWERSRRGTYVVKATFTRTLRDGGSLVSGTTTVQQPPDRLVVRGTTVDGRLGDRVVRCAGDTTGGVRCFASDEAPPYDEEVEAELDRLRPYVTGARPLYHVLVQRRGCFRLDLMLDFPSPPYGRRATFCFDDATGAPRLVEITRDEAIDLTLATEIRADVDDADLELPAPPA